MDVLTIVTVDSVGAAPKYVVPKLKLIEMSNLIVYVWLL